MFLEYGRRNKYTMIEKIIYKKRILAIIVKTKKVKKTGTNFVSPKNFTHQVGFINRPSGHVIKPHTHNKTLRKIFKTSEVLYVKNGVLRVDFYNNAKKYLSSRVLKSEDLIILNEGSHGFKIIKKCKLIEIKQGPFFKSLDKIRFKKINEKKIKIKK